MTLQKNLLGFIPVTLGEREREEKRGGRRRRGRRRRREIYTEEAVCTKASVRSHYSKYKAPYP